MQLFTNWNEEKKAAYLYKYIADHEKDPCKKQLFLELEGAAEKQASIWERKILKADANAKLVFKPDVRTFIVIQLLNIFGSKKLRFILSAMKVRGMSIHEKHPGSHAAGSHYEQRHRGITTAGNLRAGVFGVNDGLVSSASLLLGLVGASATHETIIISGVAAMLAGAFSMGSGEYISMKSQKEFFEYQIQLEKEELDLYPEEEAYELACIYRARGLDKEEAKKMADQIISNPAVALDTLAREELGLNPTELGSPVGAAISSFLAFGSGAFIPLLPFLLGDKLTPIYFSIALSSIALVTIGATLSLFTNRSAIMGGLRMLLIGAGAGAVTFMIGRWLGG